MLMGHSFWSMLPWYSWHMFSTATFDIRGYVLVNFPNSKFLFFSLPNMQQREFSCRGSVNS